MFITYNNFVQFIKMLNKFADENNFSFQYSTNKNKNQCGLYEYANSYEYHFIHNPTDRTFKYTVKWDLVDSLSEAASTIFADLKSQTIICSYPFLDITKVIFNSPATIVMWSDGTKTIVKCKKDEKFDPEKGLAMAISKKFLGNKGNYAKTFKKWIKVSGDI